MTSLTKIPLWQPSQGIKNLDLSFEKQHSWAPHPNQCVGAQVAETKIRLLTAWHIQKILKNSYYKILQKTRMKFLTNPML